MENKISSYRYKKISAEDSLHLKKEYFSPHNNREELV